MENKSNIFLSMVRAQAQGHLSAAKKHIKDALTTLAIASKSNLVDTRLNMCIKDIETSLNVIDKLDKK